MENGFEKVRHYVFDLYGTLVDIHTDEDKAEVWETAAERFCSLGAAYAPRELKRQYAAEVETLTAECAAAHPELQSPEIDLGTVFRRLCARKGVTAGDGQIAALALSFRQASTEFLRAYDGASEMLTALRKRGRVWLLSNAQSLFTRP